jgi:hypothetical protein
MRAREFVNEAQRWPDIESAKRAFVANPRFQHLPVSTRQAMGASAYQKQRPEFGDLADRLKTAPVKHWQDTDEDSDKSITYHGQSYMNTPRIQSLIQQAQVIESQLPPVRSGMTRLWRGNRQGEAGSNPSFTNSLVGIALPFLEQYGGSLTYIDVPTQDLSQYVHTVASAPGAEFTVTPELAAQAQFVKENFADGQVKGKSRPGRVKRAGASCKGSVTDLRARAKKSSGERKKMYQWCANMKSGKAKAKKE